MKKIGSLISPFLKDLGVEEAVGLEKIRRDWQTLFNEPLSLHMCPFLLKNGELIINVDSPVWLQQISFYKTDIIKKLAGSGITEVRLKLGKVRQETALPARGKKKSVEAPTPIDPETMRYIDETVSEIQDAELKNAIKKSMTKAFSRKRRP